VHRRHCKVCANWTESAETQTQRGFAAALVLRNELDGYIIVGRGEIIRQI
jgi:hypothetical protein